MVVRGGHTFVSHLKVGGQEFFNQNVREGQHFLLEKIPKFPSPPPPKKIVPSLRAEKSDEKLALIFHTQKVPCL